MAADKSFLAALFEGPLGLGPLPDQEVQAIRLGKRGEAATQPMLIKLNSEALKTRLMASLKNLKNADDMFKVISVAHDLTVKQMVAIKTALSKAQQEHRESEESQQGNWKFRVVGHQKKPRILKVRVAKSEKDSHQTIEHIQRQHYNQVVGE